MNIETNQSWPTAVLVMGAVALVATGARLAIAVRQELRCGAAAQPEDGHAGPSERLRQGNAEIT